MSIVGQALKVLLEKEYSYQSRAAILQAIGNCETQEKKDEAASLATEIAKAEIPEQEAVRRILTKIKEL